MATTHTDLVNAVMLAVTQAIPGAVAFRVETGSTFHRCARCGTPAPTRRYGIVGSCDVRGYLPNGRGFEIECKVGTDRLRQDQRNWRDMCARIGVVWFEARAHGADEVFHAARLAAEYVSQQYQQQAAPESE